MQMRKLSREVIKTFTTSFEGVLTSTTGRCQTYLLCRMLDEVAKRVSKHVSSKSGSHGSEKRQASRRSLFYLRRGQAPLGRHGTLGKAPCKGPHCYFREQHLALDALGVKNCDGWW